MNGVHYRPEDAKVSVYDRGFLYGDSVFETIRTYRGSAFALIDHMQRLARSAERVGIAMPIEPSEFAAEVTGAIAAAQNPESYSRVMLSRGSGPLGLDPSLAGPALRVILIEPLVPLPREYYRNGVEVITVRTVRAADAAPGAKVGNYLESLLALRAAKAAGAHEALIVNAAGQVMEGTTSNVFVVKDGTVVTPPEEGGILPGITRAYLLTAAAGEGLTVRFAPLSPGDLEAADEVFISSSIREVLPVVRVDGKVIGSGAPGPVTRALHGAFRGLAGVGDMALPWE
jgi:branched-chain amino acid aminotransferase